MRLSRASVVRIVRCGAIGLDFAGCPLRFQLGNSCLELNHVERKLHDLREQLGLHVAHADALFLDFGFRGDLGQVVVFFNVGGDFGQRPEAVTGVEDLIRPSGGVGYDNFLCSDGAFDRQQVRGPSKRCLTIALPSLSMTRRPSAAQAV